MKKIPTLFLRDEQDRRYVTRDRNPDALWVGGGPAVATRKYDGTCLLLDDDGGWWARREVKPGKAAPDNFRPVETDETTGKTMGWEPIEQSAFAKHVPDMRTEMMSAGTYELIGPKVNGNPEQVDRHQVVFHAAAQDLGDVPTDYDGLRDFLADFKGEGIVWHHPDGRMAKLKVRDFPR